MPARERRIDRARCLAHRALTRIGDELREGRLTAGLTQSEVATMVGISRSQVSRIERGILPGVPVVTLVVIGAAVGLDISLRSFPGPEPVRDAAQLGRLSRLMHRRGRLPGLRTGSACGAPRGPLPRRQRDHSALTHIRVRILTRWSDRARIRPNWSGACTARTKLRGIAGDLSVDWLVTR